MADLYCGEKRHTWAKLALERGVCDITGRAQVPRAHEATKCHD